MVVTRRRPRRPRRRQQGIARVQRHAQFIGELLHVDVVQVAMRDHPFEIVFDLKELVELQEVIRPVLTPLTTREETVRSKRRSTATIRR